MAKATRSPKTRLDELLVARGLCANVDEARRMVWAGEIIVDGEMLDQPALRVAATAGLRLRDRHGRYVTRGGEKLEAALVALDMTVEGRCAVDVGAAGGGFTDCLLAHGASRVYAVDVARGQLAQRLRLDRRVVDLDGRDVMTLERDELDPPPTHGAVDVTFRSLSDVLPKVRELLVGERELVALLKPLQEAKLAGMGRVEDVHRAIFIYLLPRLRDADVPIRDVVASSLPGPGGALEFFLHISSPGRGEAELSQRVEAAIVDGKAILTRKSKPGRSGRKRRTTWRRLGPRHGQGERGET